MLDDACLADPSRFFHPDEQVFTEPHRFGFSLNLSSLYEQGWLAPAV